MTAGTTPKVASVKTNVLLNMINTVTSLLFPIVTFPYAARVLQPEGIGIINFQNSIVNYIVLLTSLGIPLYAVKEIAQCRDNKAQRDKTTLEILILSTILCTAGYILVWILGNFVPQIHANLTIFYILSLNILFTAIGVNWFYQGIEDFKFITIRGIIMRAICAVALFLFVKTADDLVIYSIIIVGGTVGNYGINFVHLRKHLSLRTIEWRNLRLLRHIRPTLEVFVLNVIISLYIYLNSVMLGFMAGDEAVGYFTAGTRLPQIGLTIVASIGTVLLPRCSSLIAQGDTKQFADIISKSIQFTLALSLPIIVGMSVLAIPIIDIFCGPDYTPSIPVLLFNAPIIVAIGLTNIFGIQILYPMSKTKIVIWSVSAGAITNLALNLWLIPAYGATGAAIATLFAEFAVLAVQFIMGKPYFPFRISRVNWVAYLIPSAVMGAAVWSISYLSLASIWHLILGVTLGITVYSLILVMRKDPIADIALKYLNLKNV